MAYFALSGITGCVNPASGGTLDYQDVMYNDDKIVSYWKKTLQQTGGNTNFVRYHQVIVVFENYTQQFNFLSATDRDNFYSTLPT